MVFSSSVFLFLFLPTVLAVYYGLLRKRSSRNYFLFFASLGFYAWGEPWFVFVMLVSIFGNWAFGLLAERFRNERSRAQGVVVAALVFNLSILFVFKYLTFALNVSNDLIGTNIIVPKIVLPIGISFFTFQAISYVVDVYRNAVRTGEGGFAQKNPLNVGLYIALFPQLIAGPIVRYATVADQIRNRRENFDDFSAGVCRFIVGLAKKVVLANSIAILADQAFAIPTDKLTITTAWLGALAFTFQIYFDFSGYSDMAIGLGKMFGFHFLENFNYPYISRSISEFWRRWHISLGSWFRDYIYFPIGGSRVATKRRLALNLFVVWFLTGLWHGANWTFICWGLYFFVFIFFEKLTGFEKKGAGFWPRSLKLGYAFALVLLGWVVFRADSVADAFGYYAAMFGFAGPWGDDISAFYVSEYGITLLLCALCSTPFFRVAERFVLTTKYWKIVYFPAMLTLFFVAICFAIRSTYNPFIYFNF